MSELASIFSIKTTNSLTLQNTELTSYIQKLATGQKVEPEPKFTGSTMEAIIERQLALLRKDPRAHVHGNWGIQFKYGRKYSTTMNVHPLFHSIFNCLNKDPVCLIVKPTGSSPNSKQRYNFDITMEKIAIQLQLSYKVWLKSLTVEELMEAA